MEKQELKVGQTARVFEVTKEVWLFENDFKIGNQYICDESSTDGDDIFLHYQNQKLDEFPSAVCYPEEIKLIGKLTVTKVKQ